MENSDSDTENECFESAEESFDEDEEIKREESKLSNSESEVAKLVSDSRDVDSEPQVEKDGSGNLSYRKRPERIKRSLNNNSTKTISKSSNEPIFKTDKIVPDAFFQDITSNLSKNINKSLSTIQQKSSNVKDLILSSLPVSSVNDSEGFSYDDTVETVSNEIAENKTKCPGNISVESIENAMKNDTQQENESYKNDNCTVKSSSSCVDRFCDSNEERKPPDIQGDSLKTNLLEDCSLIYSTLDNFKDNLYNCISDVLENIKPDNEIVADKNSVEDKIADKDDELKSEQALSDWEKGTIENKIQVPQLVNIAETISEPSEPETLTAFNKTISCNNEECNLLKYSESDDSSIFMHASNENSLNNLENTEKPENLPDSDVNHSKEEQLTTESECNLEELKTVLEKIVKVNENDSSNGPEVFENKCKKEDVKVKEKLDEKQDSNEGWDDFDFSDNEIEKVETHKTELGDFDFYKKKLSEAVVKENVRTDEIIPESKSPKTEEKLLNEQKSNVQCIKEPTESKEPKEQKSDDNWDWDSWDETSEKEVKIEASAVQKPKIDKVIDQNSEFDKWSGWDTFAQKPEEKQGNWGLGSWGVDMLLNKATAVTQGISNVLEAGLGAPDPETLARMEKMEREKLKELKPEEFEGPPGDVPKKNSIGNVNLFPVSGITSLVAGVTSKIVEHTKIQELGSKVITGGLDTLETFGKKTMEVLQEGDPGLKNKRALLMGDNKTVLSQVLKEARDKAEREMKKEEEKQMAKKCHFETLFDDFQGMVHLEALEMLSRQSELKLEQIRSGMNSEEQEDLNGILEEVEQLCALDECDLEFKSSVLDFKTSLQMAVEPLKNEISTQRIIQIHESVNKWLEMSSETKPSLVLINQKLVSTLAELAAATVHQFHKSGELLSVKECRKTVEEVDALSRLTNILCTEISRLCDKFMLLSHSRTSSETSGENLNSISEKVTVVMKNSTSYIKQAFNLLIPVLQLGAAV